MGILHSCYQLYIQNVPIAVIIDPLLFQSSDESFASFLFLCCGPAQKMQTDLYQCIFTSSLVGKESLKSLALSADIRYQTIRPESASLDQTRWTTKLCSVSIQGPLLFYTNQKFLNFGPGSLYRTLFRYSHILYLQWLHS